MSYNYDVIFIIVYYLNKKKLYIFVSNIKIILLRKLLLNCFFEISENFTTFDYLMF